MQTARRTYVLDTSVLLSDPRALVRFAEHEVVLPVVVISELEGKRHHPSWATSPGRRCGCSTTCGCSTAGSTRRSRSATTAAPCGSSSTTPTRRRLPAGFRLGDNDTRILAVAKNLAAEGCDVTRHLQGPADAGQGLGGRAAGRGVPRRAHRRLRLDRDGRGRGHRRADRRALRRPGSVDVDGRGRPAVPHRPGAAVLARLRARPGDARQAGAAGPRRPRRLRPARAQRRAADRARPAARPRDRHRLPGRPGRHRQDRAGPVRRARGRASSAGSTARSSSSARSTPSAARISATCPAASPRR